jgi:two-component system, cell cycle sensor histidine kinase and response regulator CckA
VKSSVLKTRLATRLSYPAHPLLQEITMTERIRILLLIVIMTLSSLMIEGITVAVLYDTALKEQTDRLVATAQSQARLLEVVAETEKSCRQSPEEYYDNLLKQIADAHSRYKGFGETGEITLAERQGDNIVFLLSHRHYDTDIPRPVPLDSYLAEPMRLALSGKSGTVIGPDYRGKTVLAAYEPVSGPNWGIVAKMDLTEVQKPFVNAGFMSLIITLFIMVLGTGLFIRITRPMIRHHEQFEAIFRAMFEQAAIGIAQIQTETCRFIRINRKYCDIVGYSREEMEQLDFKTITHPDDLQADSDNMELLKAGKICDFTMEKRYYRKDGSEVWVSLTVSPMWNPCDPPDFHIAVVQDITERRSLDEHIRKLNRIYAVLSNINQAIVRVMDMDTLFGNACRIAVKDGGFLMAWIGLLDPQTNRVIPAAWSGITDGYLEKLNIVANHETHGHGPTALEGQHILCNDIAGDTRMTQWHEDALRLGFRSFAAFPLKVSGTVRGTINLYASEPGFFIADEVKLLDELALDISFAMAFFEEETARRNAQKALLKSQMLYHDLVETSQDLIWQCDAQGRYIFLNPAWESTFGYRLEEMLGKKFTDFQEPEISVRDMIEFEKLMQGGVVKGFETVHIGKQGNPIHLVFNAKFVIDEKGSIIGTRGTAYNITERRQAEQRYRALFEDAPAMYVITRNAGGIPVIADCNGLFLSTLGYSRDEVLNCALDKFYSPASRERLFEGGYQRALSGEFDSEERELLTREGRIVSTMLRTAPEMSGGRVCGTRAMYIDITERNQMRDALIESEMRFRQIYEHIEVGLARVSLDFRIEHANRAYCRMLGYSEKELIGRHLWDITHPDSIEENLHKQQQLAIGAIDHYQMEKQFIHKQGHSISALLVSSLIRDASGKPKYFLGSVVDITDRKRAEASLRESEEKYRMLFHSMLDGFALHEILCDDCGNPCNYRFLEVNPAFERMTGLKAEKLIGKKVLDVLPGTEAYWIDAYGKVALTGYAIHFENYSVELDRYYEVTAYCPEKGRFATIFSDITDRRRAEEERMEMERRLLHAQKLESLGVMAGGIAHDFNNLLMAIMGNIELALYDISPESSARISLAESLNAAKRAADLTRQMLAYSGKGAFSFEYIALGEKVAENVSMFKMAISGNVSLNLDLSKDIPLIKADPGQIQQVIMNLIINASEAIGENAGSITLTTKTINCDEKYLAQSYLKEKPAAGYFVCLEVSDTGCGMDEETKKRLFDPFFTTKFTGRGLGMSAVLGIVKSHNGAILIDSEPGRGTTIRVLFPASDAVTETSGSAPETVQVNLALRNEGTVMIADDEDSVRELFETMVAHIGYQTLTARNGEDAVKVFREHTDEIVCVILDLTMPGMDGVSAFREMRRIRPDVTVIFSSGYSEHEINRRFKDRDFKAFLQKPFQLKELRHTLESVLKEMPKKQG